MHFFGSERGLLATPTHAAPTRSRREFDPWDAALPDQTSTQFFEITSGPGGAPCPGAKRPFAPRLQGGRRRSTAPALHGPFSLHITAPDGDQNLDGDHASTLRPASPRP